MNDTTVILPQKEAAARRALVVGSILKRLPEGELRAMLSIAETILRQKRQYPVSAGLLSALRESPHSTAYKTIALQLYGLWRSMSNAEHPVAHVAAVREVSKIKGQILNVLASSSNELGAANVAPVLVGESVPDKPELDRAIEKVYEITVGRTPIQEEIEIWKTNFQNGVEFHQFLMGMSNSPEAAKHSQSKGLLGAKSDAAFVQATYEIMLGRPSMGWEINQWESRLVSGQMSRSDLLSLLLAEAATQLEARHNGQPAHSGHSCHIMGTSKFVSVDDWRAKAEDIQRNPPKSAPNKYTHRFTIKSEPRVLVSALTSLYRGGDFIEQFMDNITSQSCFKDYGELVIVDADSPEQEYDVISRYMKGLKNIQYIRVNHCIGIYDAWNVAAKAARGEYFTNANLDDLRRRDSFELQAATLENLPFVDVVYQDLYYTFDPDLAVEKVAEFGYETNLPVVTPYNLMAYNSPHNAPMWRKRLHEELGYFNGVLKSAGDYDFWMRCLAAGKVFYKINDPHVVYYQNPKGLSTRADTRGVVEAKEVQSKYGRKLVSENLVLPVEQFCREKLFRHHPGVNYSGTDRYTCVQHSLRNAARALKYSNARVCR